MSSSEKQKSKAKATEIIDTTQSPEDDEVNSSGSDADITEQPTNSAASASTSHKKRKKKSKSKVFDALRGKGKDEVPQAVVERVLEKVKATGSINANDANAENVRLALEHLKVMDAAKGKVGLGGINRKDMGEHKVCFSSIPRI